MVSVGTCCMGCLRKRVPGGAEMLGMPGLPSHQDAKRWGGIRGGREGRKQRVMTQAEEEGLRRSGWLEAAF